jgi:hypothetical protein
VRDAFLAAGLTFASVAIWHGTGNVLSNIKSGGFGGWATRSLVHGAVGGGIRTLEGGSFKDGFLAAAIAGALPINSIGDAEQSRILTITQRTTAAGIVGGTVAAATGGNFANGAKTAAYAQLFNDLSHETMEKLKSPPKPAMAETLGCCGNQLAKDPNFKRFLALTISTTPIPKGFAKRIGSLPRNIGIGGPKISRFTSIYSIIDYNVFAGSGVLRKAGRILQKYTYIAFGGYSAGYMGACVIDHQLWGQKKCAF